MGIRKRGRIMERWGSRREKESVTKYRREKTNNKGRKTFVKPIRGGDEMQVIMR